MKRVTSRQRLAYRDSFDAAVASDEESDYETCYEGAMSRATSFVSLPADLDRSNSFDIGFTLIEPAPPMSSPRRKRGRDDVHPSLLIKKNVSFSNLVKDLQAPPDIVPAYDFEIESNDSSSCLNLLDIMNDVHLHTVSFLSVADAQHLSASCRHFNELLSSEEARFLWIDWCRHEWPHAKYLENDDVTFHNDLPVKEESRSFEVNFSLLLSMAKSLPSKIDESLFLTRHAAPTRLAQWLEQQPFPTEVPQFRKFEQDHREVLQFTGAVGSGDRCIRADQPLTKPKLCVRAQQWTFPPSPTRSPLQFKKKQSLFDRFCGPPLEYSWRPFVAPFLKGSTVHLTPRFTSYFEISILKRDLDQEPPIDIPERGTRISSECVAIGVSSGNFHLYSRMPGWDSLSYGYHGDDGGIFHASGDMIRPFGPRYGPGDTVGCGVDYICGGIFFTLNGEFLGYGWTDVDADFLHHNVLYPTVGIDTNCPIACNFGQDEFEFDLTTLLKSHEAMVTKSLQDEGMQQVKV